GFASRLEHVVPSVFGFSARSAPAAPLTRQPAVPSAGIRSAPDSHQSAATAAFQNHTQDSPTPDFLAAVGTLRIQELRVGRLRFSNVRSQLQFGPAQVLAHQITFDCSEGRGSGTASINLTPPRTIYIAQVKLSGVNMASLLTPFPKAQGNITGRLDGELT